MAEHFHDLVLESPVTVKPQQMTALALTPAQALPDWLRVDLDEIRFTTEGWFEVLMTVGWDPTNVDGTRFSHTSIPDHHPLHSEAIDATVLADVSDGRQLLRGNSLFSPDGPSGLALEVWHDSAVSIEIGAASLRIRRLR